MPITDFLERNAKIYPNDISLVEINPETGEPLPEGTKGELVFTCLDKEAFPLLRYRTRDICVLTREKCPCGRTHIRMKKPMGRSEGKAKRVIDERNLHD